jgi:hypothetical protein
VKQEAFATGFGGLGALMVPAIVRRLKVHNLIEVG